MDRLRVPVCERIGEQPGCLMAHLGNRDRCRGNGGGLICEGVVGGEAKTQDFHIVRNAYLVLAEDNQGAESQIICLTHQHRRMIRCKAQTFSSHGAAVYIVFNLYDVFFFEYNPQFPTTVQKSVESFSLPNMAGIRPDDSGL